MALLDTPKPRKWFFPVISTENQVRGRKDSLVSCGGSLQTQADSFQTRVQCCVVTFLWSCTFPISRSVSKELPVVCEMHFTKGFAVAYEVLQEDTALPL